MSPRSRKARLADVAEIALSLPHTQEVPGWGGNPAFQVGSKLFCGFRSARPDALDPDTGQRLTDVILFWTPDEEDKVALAQAPGPWFTTPHFDGFNAILIRSAHLDQVTRAELEEVIIDAWRTRASATRVRRWEQGRAVNDPTG